MAAPYKPPGTRSNPPGTRGAPLAINRILEQRDGHPYTVTDCICEIISLGEHPRTAATCARIHIDSLYDTAGAGARLSYDVERGARHEDGMSPTETAQLAFFRRLGQAFANGERRHAALRGQAMQGGTRLVTETTTTREVKGQVETTIVRKVETLGPDTAMLRWFAERRWPQQFGNRLAISMETGDRDPLDVSDDDRVAAMLTEALEFDPDVIDAVEVAEVDR